jgi:hypothetical protein
MRDVCIFSNADFFTGVIENVSERDVSLVFRKSSCKKIFDDYNATPSIVRMIVRAEMKSAFGCLNLLAG